MAPVILLVELLVLMLLQAAVHRLIQVWKQQQGNSDGAAEIAGAGVRRVRKLWYWCCSKIAPVNRDRYIAAGVGILLFCYIQVGVSTISYMKCIDVAGASVVFVTPSLICDSAIYARHRILVLLLLVLYIGTAPVALFCFLLYHRHRSTVFSSTTSTNNNLTNSFHKLQDTTAADNSPSTVRNSSASNNNSDTTIAATTTSIVVSPVGMNGGGGDGGGVGGGGGAAAAQQFAVRYGLLYAGYDRRCWYWQCVVLVRRLLLVLVRVVLAESAGPKYMTYTLLHIGFVSLHQLAAPFTHANSNRMEFASLVLLAALSSLLTAYVPPVNDDSVSVFLFLLVVPFTALLLSIIMYHKWRLYGHKLPWIRKKELAVELQQRMNGGMNGAADSTAAHVTAAVLSNVSHDHSSPVAQEQERAAAPVLPSCVVGEEKQHQQHCDMSLTVDHSPASPLSEASPRPTLSHRLSVRL